MRLDFPYTCPDIDRSIRIINDGLENYFITLLEELSPLTPYQTIRNYAKVHSEEVYSQIIESAIESVRDTNDKLRTSAENKMEELEYTISTLEEEIGYLNKQLKAE